MNCHRFLQLFVLPCSFAILFLILTYSPYFFPSLFQSTHADEGILPYLIFYLAPFLFFATAMFLKRNLLNEIPYRSALIYTIFSCIPHVYVGVFLILKWNSHEPFIFYSIACLLIQTACLYGFFRPFSFVDVIKIIDNLCSTGVLSLEQIINTLKLRYSRIPPSIFLTFSFVGILLIIYLLPLGGAGYCGEMGTRRFRLAVWTYDVDHSDFRLPSIQEAFGTKAGNIKQYGNYRFFRKVGGISEYFGLTKIDCRQT